jgi:hypothetical protein
VICVTDFEGKMVQAAARSDGRSPQTGDFT